MYISILRDNITPSLHFYFDFRSLTLAVQLSLMTFWKSSLVYEDFQNFFGLFHVCFNRLMAPVDHLIGFVVVDDVTVLPELQDLLGFIVLNAVAIQCPKRRCR